MKPPTTTPPPGSPAPAPSPTADGRCRPLLAAENVQAGKHRLTFAVAPYFAATRRSTLYPEITITFLVAHAGESYHIPLLLSPFGYSTYRGT